ncbi:hypothetical protein GE09DRAFT_101230 [Coniochaeta sp. 2T2.1]|nr:hypothetical protein GE09DRAFT_101230 [Coniochaeta sp. 2T2.1]
MAYLAMWHTRSSMAKAILVLNRYVISRSLGDGVEDVPGLCPDAAEAEPRVSLRIAAASCDHHNKSRGPFVAPEQKSRSFAWHRRHLPDACHTHRTFASSPASPASVRHGPVHIWMKMTTIHDICRSGGLTCLQLPTPDSQLAASLSSYLRLFPWASHCRAPERPSEPAKVSAPSAKPASIQEPWRQLCAVVNIGSQPLRSYMPACGM